MRVVCCFEAGHAVGAGHAMRSATIADELVRRGHEVEAYVAGQPHDFVVATWESIGIGLRQLRVTDDRPHAQADVSIIDGYGLAPLVDRAIRCTRVAVVDDNGEIARPEVHWVVNQNVHAASVDYSAIDSDLLLGPRFALLRREVRELVPMGDGGSRLDVLVVMGGSDPARLTVPVVAGLLDQADDSIGRVHVALGDRHPDRHDLDRLIIADRRIMPADPDLISSLARADLAIVGAGTTMWELAHLGIPSVLAIVADNQRAGGLAAAEAGIGIALEALSASGANQLVDAASGLIRDPERRARMGATGRLIFDGRGVERVVDALETSHTMIDR